MRQVYKVGELYKDAIPRSMPQLKVTVFKVSYMVVMPELDWFIVNNKYGSTGLLNVTSLR